MNGLSLHDRQATVVPPIESHTTSPAGNSEEQSTAYAPVPEETAAIPITSANTFAHSFSQAATPLNDTFLSTLAPMPIHQRLDLADQIDTSSQGHGSGVPETLEEESDSLMESERDGDGLGAGAGDNGNEGRVGRRGSGVDQEGVFELAGP